MQHQYWITKQTICQKFGRKEDECIIASDAELDTKLELLRNIQTSCTLIQRIIEKYQESVCYLSQEMNSMGRFLKENSNEDKTSAAKIMLSIGKSLTFCAQQQLAVHDPLLRFHQELETFRQRAIGDTLKNILAMEKARTEYRAALSWMKNVSRQLDPDTSKQLERFKKVQNQVRRGKANFDKLSLDCLQKVDLLSAARCNMLNQALSLYHNKLLQYSEKTAEIYVTVAETLLVESSENVLLEIQTQTLQAHNNRNNSTDNILQEELLLTTGNKLIPHAASDMVFLHCEGVRNEFEYNETKLERQSLSGEYCNASGNQSFADCTNHLNKNMMDQSDHEVVSSINFNFEDTDHFLPSSLLLESLDLSNIAQESETRIKTMLEDRNNIQSMNSNGNSKSWIKIFEELDPLSNQIEDKLSENKHSC